MLYSKNKNFLWNIIKQLSNLNLSIIILLVIAILSFLGTIIEQDQSVDYYKLHYPISNNAIWIINWKMIMILGLDHVYTTSWFFLLLILFFCSLITCTFSRQLPSLRNARNWKFMKYSEYNPNTYKLKMDNSFTLSKIIYELNINHYYVFHRHYNTYAYKGIIGRIAPIFVHISIIVTLIGALLGLFNGFTAQQMIPNQEVFHIQNVIKSGYNSSLPTNLIGKINNFRVEYNNDESIKQFYTDISLLDNNGKCLTRKQMSVNFPLIFKGTTLYQTDWQINALRIEINDKYQIQQKLHENFIKDTKIWTYKLYITDKYYITLIITDLKSKIFIYNTLGQLIHKIGIGERFQINGVNIKIKEIMTETGIQVKTDPGIMYVYLGFLVLIVSIMISYLSYSQIWINKQENNIYIRGTTNRSTLSFEEELKKIYKNIIQYSSNDS